jgi:hypothetical protein
MDGETQIVNASFALYVVYQKVQSLAVEVHWRHWNSEQHYGAVLRPSS